MALAITIALHVALVAGLLAMKVVESISEQTTVIQLKDLEQKTEPIPVVKPIDPDLVDLHTIQPPAQTIQEIQIDDRVPEQLSSAGILAATRYEPVSVAISSAPDTPLRYQAVRPSDDFYPPQAIRMERQGAVIVRACVDTGGRLTGVPAVVKSSRESSLDAAAVRWASEALRFQPATRAGVAIESCKEFRVNFTLH